MVLVYALALAVLVVAALAVLTGQAHAQGREFEEGGGPGAVAGAAAGAVSVSGASASTSTTVTVGGGGGGTGARQSNSQQIVFNNPAQPSEVKQTVKNVPEAIAPSINATAPCRLPVTGGLSIVGGGFSAGATVLDEGCDLRETARVLHGIGYGEAAARVMCANPYAAAALGASVCVAPGAPAAGTASVQCHPDIVVAARMGMAVCN